MSWWLRIKNEKGEIPEVLVNSFYIGGTYEIEPNTGLTIVGPCEVNVTYNYSRLLREAGMKDALNGYYGREIDQQLVDELCSIEANLERMCVEVEAEPSGDYWNGDDPYNVLKFVHWFREVSEKLVARGGKFVCEVT